MKRTSGLLFLCSTLWMVAACVASDPADVAITIQNIGLSSVTVPPSGEGVAPVIGSPGDGAAVVTRIGGWSGGPGAVQWHGGQWIVPYQAQPGGVLANMFCDVKPNATSTDLVELVGSNGVIGSTTVPATTNNVIIRAWILPTGGYTVHDGEHFVMRHSPRDSTTGAWTGATQDLTIISCAVNTTSASTTRTVRFRPQWLQQGPFVISSNPTGGSAGPSVWRSAGPSPANASFEIPFRAGETIIALGWDAYGTGANDNSGLGSIDVFYQPSLADTVHRVQPAATFDVNRSAAWGQVSITPFSPTLLSDTGFLWVNLEVDAIGYYIGDITATFAVAGN